MAHMSNLSYLPFWKLNFGFVGSWIIWHLQTILLLFPTTYECEVGFSSLLQIKTKDRNRPDVEDDL
jgi:hypothetical protein